MKRLKPAYGMTRPITLSFALLCCALMLFLPACNLFESAEDKNSDNAKMEEAAIHIDKGNYEKAESILNKIYNKNPETTDPKLLALLSNAVSGQVGLDTFNVLEIADDLADSDTDGGIDLVGMVLGDEESRLTRAELEDKLRKLNGDGDGAIFFLLQIERERKTSDHYAQSGLLSLIDTILLFGDIIAYDLGVDSLKLTENSIKQEYNTIGASFPYNPDLENYVVNEPSGFTRLDRLNENIKRIEKSIDEILFLAGDEHPEDNDLTEIFNDFLSEVIDNKGDITYNSLMVYINGLLY